MSVVHLEVHSHFTLLGGTASVTELAARAAADGMPSLALTDTNALYGVIAFARACRAAAIAPIIGMTVTLPNPPAPFPFDRLKADTHAACGASAKFPPETAPTGEKQATGLEALAGLVVDDRNRLKPRIQNRETIFTAGSTRKEGDVRPAPDRGGVGGEVGGAESDVGHLVLLATHPAGYRSLCRLSSLVQGRSDREARAAAGLTWDELAAHHEGLICLSGGRRGWIERALQAGDRAAAQVYAGRLAGIFDQDAYLALEIHTLTDRAIAAEVAALGRRLGLPTVAVQPIYCLTPEDAPRLRLLAAIRQNRPLMQITDDEPETESLDDEAHPAQPGKARPPAAPRNPGAGRQIDTVGEAVDVAWLNPAEIAARLADFPAALAQTNEIAGRCGDVLPSGRPIWPALKLPADQTPDVALAELAHAGLRRRYAALGYAVDAGSAELAATSRPVGNRSLASSIQARLAYELSAIAQHGYAPLFLVVADAVRFARSQGIPVSTRGSVANSLVAYCTGITTVDPIAHGLIFERFLNPARADPPDIDLDFCSQRRDEVLRYLRDTYGPEHVALVCTISTMRPQSALRETGKAYGLSGAEIERLVALAPRGWHPDPRRRDQRTLADILPDIAAPHLREVVAAAATLVGQPDHLSVHPGGVVITPGPLTDVVPVQWAPKGFLVTQFEHGDVEAIGLPKMDLLGIRALTVLAHAAELARQITPDFRVEDIPLDDPLTAALLARGETIGVFQCESDGAQRTLRKLRARTVRDLAIANAFFKPGPATGGMAGVFVRRYRGEAPTAYLHPALEPILADTKGVLIFQEQVLRVAREVAGLDWALADQLRRGMGHFGAAEMAALQEQFNAGCRRPSPVGPGFTELQARTLWEQVIAFAGYGFNQGHATAYADVSFRSAYMKAHWPAEFLCARLADSGGFHHPAVYIAEALRLGIAVRPPHVNFSQEAFTFVNAEYKMQNAGEGDVHSALRTPHSAILYMGLGQVRGLRSRAVQALVAERAQRPFEGVRDLVGRVELQAKELTHLIQCGALDGLGATRGEMLAEASAAPRSARKPRAQGRTLQLTLPFAFDTLNARDTHPEPVEGPVAERFDTLNARAAPPEPVEGPLEPLAQRLAWETDVLGLPISAYRQPLAAVADRLPDHLPLRRLPETSGRPVTVAGVRLPGWTGGSGFFLWDGETFVIAKQGKDTKSPPPWQPLLVRGRWLNDGWGSPWLQADAVQREL